MILILSNRDDVHANVVASKLQARGEPLAWVDHRQFPRGAGVSVRSAGRELRAIWKTDEGEIDLSALKSIWHRRPYTPRASSAIQEAALRQAIEADADLFLRDLWNSLGCLTVPAPSAVYRRADYKASQLATALGLGLEIPDTLITNDPDAFLDFYRTHGGGLISKLVSPVFNRDYLDGVGIRYTEPVSTSDVGHYRSVAYSPTTFQAYVPKQAELRITFVGNSCFAAEIRSQESRRTKHDWRHYDTLITPIYEHQLPREVEEKLAALIKHFGLNFGAIDMVLTPDGRYVFLELNPNGQFLWIEDATGLPISDAVCDLLASGGRSDQAEASFMKGRT